MEVSSRKLNKNEKYACSIGKAKKAFLNEPAIYIIFGVFSKHYRPDSAFIKHPKIKGRVICSLSFNRRLNISLPFEIRPYLDFYAIPADEYTEKYEQEFCDAVLPQMQSWLAEVRLKPDTALPGVEELLVEWTGRGFILHACRYK